VIGLGLCVGLAITGQTDTAINLSSASRAGAGLVPAGGADPDGNLRRQSRAGGTMETRLRSELVGEGRRFGWGFGADGTASVQFGEGVVAASSVLDPNSDAPRQNFLFFWGVGGDAAASRKLLPTLTLRSRVRGQFQRSDAFAGGASLDAPPEEQPQPAPQGTAFFERTSIDGSVGLDGTAGRRLTWATDAQARFSENRALDVDDQEIGDLADTLSVQGSGYADWSVTRRSFLGAGLTGQYAEFQSNTPGLSQSSVILTGEGRFRRILSERWQLALKAGAFITVPVEPPEGSSADEVDGFPVLDAKITYFEPPRERFSYRLSGQLSLTSRLDQQLGQVAPQVQAGVSFDARFDEDWSFTSQASLASVVGAPPFPVRGIDAQEPAGRAPLLQSSFRASATVVRRLDDEWSASLGVRGGGQMRQLFSIEGELDREGTPEALRGFDVAFAQFLVEFGLRWDKRFAL